MNKSLNQQRNGSAPNENSHKQRLDQKAICIIINDRNELLVTEDYDDDKKEMFYLPLGGHVMFYENPVDALKRELKEEINAELTDISAVSVLENFFTWHGKDYDEINYVYKAKLADKELYNNNDIPFLDAKYPNAKVKWVSLNNLCHKNHIIYPKKLCDVLCEMVGKQ